jgi:hypothetical protein
VVIHPANNRRIFAALITPSPEEQVAGRLQRELIARLAPGLAGLPVNPVPVGRRLRRRVGAYRRGIRAQLARLWPRPADAPGVRPFSAPPPGTGVDSQTKCATGYVRGCHGTEIQPPQP